MLPRKSCWVLFYAYKIYIVINMDVKLYLFPKLLRYSWWNENGSFYSSLYVQEAGGTVFRNTRYNIRRKKLAKNEEKNRFMIVYPVSQLLDRG